MSSRSMDVLPSLNKSLGRILLVLFLLVSLLSHTAAGIQKVSAGSYNRGAAAAYMDQWTHGRNPNYLNFTDNDCTNFNSQGLTAGGMPMVGYGGIINDDNNWYYTQNYVTSYSWGAADHMNVHFTWHPERYNNTTYDQLTTGDVIIFLLPPESVPSHGRFVIGYGTSSSDGVTVPPGTYGLLTDQHSDDKYHVLWDDNLPSGTGYWGWDVVY